MQLVTQLLNSSASSRTASVCPGFAAEAAKFAQVVTDFVDDLNRSPQNKLRKAQIAEESSK